MNPTIQLEKIRFDEIPILIELAKTTFDETFAWCNTPENMFAYTSTAFTTEQMRSELEQKLSWFYFAKINGQAVAYLKVNFGQAQTELQDENALEVQRIYVLQAFQNQKVGQILLDKAFEIAKQNHLKYIWLAVWEGNHKALRFYQKNGFEQFSSHHFVMGDDVQTDLMFKKSIVN